VEYGEIGDGAAAMGPPLLVLHGAGGGYDQALLLGRLMVREDYHILAPSRYGYLGTPIPQDASIEAQADAYACLLDVLEVDRVAVVAVSAGGPSGLHFALRHPARTVALVTVSAIAFGGTPEAEVHWNRMRASRALESDFVYWAGSIAVRFGLRAALVFAKRARSAPREWVGLDQILQAMLPLCDRLSGTRLDRGRCLPPDAPFDRIAAPTLVIHARDDPLVPFAHAEYIAARTPAAELMAFKTGGHYLLGHTDEIEARLASFLTASRDSCVGPGRGQGISRQSPGIPVSRRYP
jgi:pimeloyl-ACP methyl ester carboxylesterase